MGKDWAKGLTKETDPRIARAAAGHRGLRYVRRKPVEECNWRLESVRTLPIGWSNEMAYVVGLTATDGCLATARRQISFKSQDRELVATYLRLLGRSNTIGVERTRAGNLAYRTQFGDADLYEWFRSVGMAPRKSLILGAIAVPTEQLPHLVRGLLDGDGSILNYTYQGTGKAHGVYEALTTCFVSGSRAHIDWLREQIRLALGIWGSIGSHRPPSRLHHVHRLAYAKRESKQLLPWLYPSAAVPCLARKRAIWDAFVARSRTPAVQ
ncbi:MAG: hypothetical protein AAB295_01910 [Chloroflexota bacterium]